MISDAMWKNQEINREMINVNGIYSEWNNVAISFPC